VIVATAWFYIAGDKENAEPIKALLA